MTLKNYLLIIFRKYFLIFLWLICCFGFVDKVWAKIPTTIEIMVEDDSEPWANHDGTGYTNDIVVAAFKQMKVNVHLIVVPYARCKRMVLNGSVAACFNMSWLPEFEGQIVLAQHPLAYYNADVYESIDKPLIKPKDGLCKLPKGTQVGVVNGYEYPKQVDELLTSGVLFEKTHGDGQSLQMLAKGRLDAAILTTSDLVPGSRKLIEEKVQKNVRFAFNCGRAKATIGFSLKHADGLWAYKAYEQGYGRLLKRQTELKKIRQKWFPNNEVK